MKNIFEFLMTRTSTRFLINTLLIPWRTTELERRMRDRRRYAIDQLLDYLIVNEIPGDYLEFGVYQGRTFSYAYRQLAPHFSRMRFFAFDSFEGLPQPKGVDALHGFTSSFYEGQFAVSREDFVSNLKRNRVDLHRVRIVPGWFDQTLKQAKATEYDISRIAAVWIDCDLYESTVPVLDFLTHQLSVGSVLLFDDWRCYRNLPDHGEQRACREWLARNPLLQLHEVFSFGWHGQAFSVGAH
jgi:O-methyltransferase